MFESAFRSFFDIYHENRCFEVVIKAGLFWSEKASLGLVSAEGETLRDGQRGHVVSKLYGVKRVLQHSVRLVT